MYSAVFLRFKFESLLHTINSARMAPFRSTISLKLLACFLVFTALINVCIFEKSFREMEKNKVSFYDVIKGRNVYEKGNDGFPGGKAMVELSSLLINSAMTNNTKGQEDNYQQQGIVGTVQDNSSASALPSSPYAYVWIIGAINENRPSYKGFLWDVLISASLLRKAGSTADFWLYLRFSPNSTLTEMPEEDTRLLNEFGIQTKYLEKPKHESFGQLVYDKFLTLNMTDYKRVMFLDADIVPLTNLDYYFHLSDPGYTNAPTVLKPNFIVATRGEPCNTGMFIVEPSFSIFKEYRETVRAQRKDAKDLPRHFDPNKGWGHSFWEYGDQWESMHKRGKKWKFYAAHSDQGLMYYVARFLYQDVSIAMGRKVQNWKGVDVANKDETKEAKQIFKPEKESEDIDVLERHQPPLSAYMYSCDQEAEIQSKRDGGFSHMCNPPYNSFGHFTGSHKPWQNKFEMSDLQKSKTVNDNTRKLKAVTSLWFQELQELNDRLRMGLDLENWNEKYLGIMKQSPLGYMATWGDSEPLLS